MKYKHTSQELFDEYYNLQNSTYKEEIKSKKFEKIRTITLIEILSTQEQICKLLMTNNRIV